MAHDVFISYSSPDKVIADNVCGTLEQQRIRCWMAPRDIQPGSTFPAAISRAISACSVLVLIVSDCTNASKWVSVEVFLAFDLEKTIVPFRVRDTELNAELKLVLGNVHWLDARTLPLESHLNDLATTVAQFLKKEPVRPVLDNAVLVEAQKKAETEFRRLEADANAKVQTEETRRQAEAERMRQDFGGMVQSAHELLQLQKAVDFGKISQAELLVQGHRYTGARTVLNNAIHLLPTDPSVPHLQGLSRYADFMAQATTAFAGKNYAAAVAACRGALLALPHDVNATVALRSAQELQTAGQKRRSFDVLDFWPFLANIKGEPGGPLAFLLGGGLVEVLIIVSWVAGGWPGAYLGVIQILVTLFGWLPGGLFSILLHMGTSLLVQSVNRWVRRGASIRSHVWATMITAATLLVVLYFLAPILWTRGRLDRFHRLKDEGEAALQVQNVYLAIPKFNGARSIMPDDLNVMYKLYICYRRIGYSDAIVDADQAIAKAPNNCFGYGLRGLARQAVGDYQYAADDLAIALQLCGSDAAGDALIAMLQDAANVIKAEHEAVKEIESKGGAVGRTQPGIAVAQVLWGSFAQDFADQPGKLRVLNRLKFLESLNLADNIGVTDTDLVDIKDLKKLRVLNLAGTAVTDAGLKQLKGLQSLRELTVGQNLWGKTWAGPGLDELRNALPDCHIATSPPW